MALRDVDRFEEIVNEIKKLVEWYENKRFKNKKMRLFLNNKDTFMYSVPEDKIAHLLGININNIQSLGIYKNTSSYGLLKEFLRDSYRICDGIRKNTIKLDYIFSKHINKKINGFKRNISLNLNDITFVCKYDRKKAYNDGKNIIKSDYYIIKVLEDGTILELDLVLSPDKKYLYPVSNKMYVDEFEAEEDLKKILEKQEITIAHSMLLYNYEDDIPMKFYLKDYEKIEKLNVIKNYITKYGCTIDLLDECERLYKNTNSNREKSSNNYEIYETIIDYIVNGKLIPTNKLGYLSSQQYELIDAINDNIINSSSVNNDENQESYSKLRKSVENLQKVKQELIDENKKLKESIKEKDETIKSLEEDNELKSNFINNITNSFNDYNEKVKKISK